MNSYCNLSGQSETAIGLNVCDVYWYVITTAEATSGDADPETVGRHLRTAVDTTSMTYIRQMKHDEHRLTIALIKQSAAHVHIDMNIHEHTYSYSRLYCT